MFELTTCELKLARANDATVLAEMSRDYIEHGLGWRWRPSKILAKIRAPETIVLIAEVEWQNELFIGGFAAMDFGANNAILSLLAVDPRLRRHGIAGQLLRWLHKSALIAGCFDIELQVREGNTAALGFYDHMGYQLGGRLPGYYLGKEGAYQMTIQLATS